MKKLGVIALLVLFITPPAVGTIRPPRSGVGLRFSSFGIPKVLLDAFLYEHPGISGQGFTFEIRSYGSKGPQSVFSGVFALEYSRMTGEGYWRETQEEIRKSGTGEASQVSATATILMHIFPRLPVHPYIGAGIGLGRISIWSEGVHTDELGTQVKETYHESMIIPVGHLPVGLIARLGHNFELRIEGGFKNGFYFGGGLVYNF